MADTRVHRGPHPEDARLFASEARPRLAAAAADLCWLLTHGYARSSALKLVGDRYALEERQRTAVARSACSDQSRASRAARRIGTERIAGEPLGLDGYNVLITVEAALAGGVILAARDGAYRDMASMHGTYRAVDQTRPALQWLGRTLAELGAGACRWYLDRPVSNSGRLRQIMLDVAGAAGWDWNVELVADPDPLLWGSPRVAVTADSAILDRCRAWFNLARETIERHLPEADVVRM